MSTRTRLAPTVVLAAGNMSGNLTSAPTVLGTISSVGYFFKWSGTSPVGTVSIQVSWDYALNPDGTVANTGTWNTITLNNGGTATSTISISGNTGATSIDPIQTTAPATRAIYTFASGVGSLTITVAGKVS